MKRYFVEQGPNQFFASLSVAKISARSLSKRREGGVYLIEEEFNPEIGDYVAVGSIAFYDGVQDAREGSLA